MIMREILCTYLPIHVRARILTATIREQNGWMDIHFNEKCSAAEEKGKRNRNLGKLDEETGRFAKNDTTRQHAKTINTRTTDHPPRKVGAVSIVVLTLRFVRSDKPPIPHYHHMHCDRYLLLQNIPKQGESCLQTRRRSVSKDDLEGNYTSRPAQTSRNRHIYDGS